jgi:bile acid:Na+ symporter, BASS family
MTEPLWSGAVRILTGAFLFTMMLAIGLSLAPEPKLDRKAKRHKRSLLVRGLMFNLLLLPMLALLLTELYHPKDDVAIAFLLLAAAPGGRFAPQFARIAGAEVGLSVEIALWITKLVAFTAPVTARLMLHTEHIELHELPFILQLLLLQLLPYIVGRQLRKRRPEFALRLAKPVEVAMWILLVVLVGVIITRLHDIGGLVRGRGWIAALIFAVTAPALGWLLGGPERKTRGAFALSANARNVAVAALMAAVAFKDGNVQVATIGVWFVLLVADFLLALLFAPRRTGRAARPLQLSTPRGGTP